LANVRRLGRSTRKIRKLADDGPPAGKLFQFFRYDIRLEQDWIAKKLRIQASEKDIERLREMSDPSNVRPLYEIAKAAALHQVKDRDWETALPSVAQLSLDLSLPRP
jgi:hypothetical protein